MGVDEVADLALRDLGILNIIKPVTLNYSDDIKAGEDVIAMGFPQVNELGDTPTITKGIVSAVRSSVSELTLIQTDAAINPGSSGGPLLGRHGRVIGINSSKIFSSDDGRPLEGIGLAVSVNDIRSRLPSLELGKSVFLDTSSDFGTEELASTLDDFLPASFEELDPQAEELSISDLGLEDYFSDLVAYASADPFQVIVAATGELTDLERIALEHELSDPETFLNDVFKGAFMEVAAADAGVEIDDSGLMDLGQIGDGMAGVWMDLVFDEVELRYEMVMFLRGDLVGLVYGYYFPTTQPSIPTEDVARVIDQAMLEYSD